MSLSHRPRGNFKKILAKSADELEGEYLKLLDKAAMLRQMRQDRAEAWAVCLYYRGHNIYQCYLGVPYQDYGSIYPKNLLEFPNSTECLDLNDLSPRIVTEGHAQASLHSYQLECTAEAGHQGMCQHETCLSNYRMETFTAPETLYTLITSYKPSER